MRFLHYNQMTIAYNLDQSDNIKRRQNTLLCALTKAYKQRKHYALKDRTNIINSDIFSNNLKIEKKKSTILAKVSNQNNILEMRAMKMYTHNSK